MSRAVEGLCHVLDAGESVAACFGAQGPGVFLPRVIARSLLLIWACAKVSLAYGAGHAPSSASHLKPSYFSRVNKEGGGPGLWLFSAEE